MVGNLPGQTIFKKVAVSEKKMLFREIADDKLQLSMKGSINEDVFHLIAVQTDKDETLLCHHTADSKDVTQPQKVVVNFPFKSERYFFQTELSFSVGWAVLKTDVDLFQLQRRANARIDIPGKYEAIFSILHHGGKVHFVESRVRDVSAGGLKIEFKGAAPDLKIGDQIKGALRLGLRRAMEFDVEVRFAQKREVDGQVIQTAGLQFLNVTNILETRLLSLMMDLQRELFLKYPKK